MIESSSGAPLAFHSHVFLGEEHDKNERRTWAVGKASRYARWCSPRRLSESGLTNAVDDERLSHIGWTMRPFGG